MSFNPYASESASRIKVRSDPKEIEESKKIDHPLIEGKKLDMSPSEMNNFTKAMKHDEFQSIMSEYVDEISDPKHREEHDQYLHEMVERGEMPPGSQLIQPEPGFCLKTTGKRMVSDTKKTFFDQKSFLNVCYHESVDKPRQVSCKGPDGKNGSSWQLPYRCSKGKHDQDNKKEVCMTYDVVFHSDVRNFVVQDEFKKFVCDSAIDGVNRMMAENKEKLSHDYKIMKHMLCKGVRPQLMAIKEVTGNPLIDNMDAGKLETKLQTEVREQQEEYKAKEQKAADERKAAGGVESDEEEESAEEERPLGIIQPKYKIVHSFPVDLADSWDGHKGTEEAAQMKGMLRTLPTELTVTIECKWIDSIKNANLDINESTLLFEYPEVYYLDLNLKYKCDCNAGNAKFDKSKKTLTIRLPVVGLTEDSQKVADADYAKFLEHEKERKEELAMLEKSRMDEEAEERGKRKLPKEDDSDEDKENAGDNILGESGMSKPKFIELDKSGEEKESGDIEDKYAQGKKDSNKDVDRTAQDRNSFLKVFDKKQVQRTDDEDDTPDLSQGIKFKENLTSEEDSFDLKTSASDTPSNGKALIQELSSEDVQKQAKQKAANSLLAGGQPMAAEIKEFDWETAERVELKASFISQMDLVFLNISFKGYKKDEDVRYALSADEFLIEVRDRSTKENRIHRKCVTLEKRVNVEQSQVKFLYDVICIQLMKQDKNESWNDFGFDISNFNKPQPGVDMKSNFITIEKPAEPEPEEQAVALIEADAEDEEPTIVKVTLTDEQVKELYEEQIRKTIEGQQSNMQCFMDLQSCDSIFTIY